MGCDRLSRFSPAASLAALAFTVVTTLAACAESVEDSSDPLSGDGGGTATADAGAHPIPGRDGSASSPDASTGGGGTDAETPPPDAAADPDTGGGAGPVDSGGGGPVSSDCPNSPIYAIEGLAELAATNPRLCSSGCAATECCYGTLVCVNL
jgi:hypothetical protein